MEEKIPSSLFDTNNFEVNSRVEIYKQSVGEFFTPESINAGADNFYATIKSYLINDLLLVDTNSTSQRFLRNNRQISSDNLDHYLIQLYLSGRTVDINQPDQIYCHQDLLVVIDLTRPWNAFNTNFRGLTLVLPRRLLSPKLKNPNDQHGKILNPSQNLFAKILRSYILAMHGALDFFENRHTDDLSPLTADLVGAALNFGEKRDEAIKNQEQGALKVAVKQLIERELHNPRLCVDMIQAELGLTRSTLYRLFPASEGGIMSYAKARRLEKAYRSLSLFPNGEKTVSQTAFEHGFENLASFTRAFKNRFEVTPGEVKSLDSTMNSTERSQRLWETWFRVL